MRYLRLAAISLAALALAACKPSASTVERVPMPSNLPEPMTPNAPSAPVVPPDPPQPTTTPKPGGQQTLLFMGPMELTIRLKTNDNFETAEMTDNSEHTVHMFRVPSESGVRLEDGEGVAMEFQNGQGRVEFSPDHVVAVEEYRLP